MPSTPKTPRPAEAPAASVVDPLADLRQDDDTSTVLAVVADTDEDPAVGIALVTQERQDEARTEVITAWHADTVAVGFLHKGGRCGCHYLAGVALRAVMAVQPAEDLADNETPDEVEA